LSWEIWICLKQSNQKQDYQATFVSKKGDTDRKQENKRTREPCTGKRITGGVFVNWIKVSNLRPSAATLAELREFFSWM